MNNVKVIRSIKRRTVTLQIMPDTSIQVTVPFYLSQSKIENFLKEKESWIHQKQQLVKARTLQRESSNEETYLYLGKAYQLEIRPHQKSIIEVEDKMYLGSPNKKYLKTYVTSWYKQQARKIIIERVHLYAKLSGSTFKSITITSAETRWGSCSNEKSLNFNWKLIMAPLEVIDYVVVHELSHLTELNHSKHFWETVRKMYPLYRQYRTWLKRNGHTLSI